MAFGRDSAIWWFGMIAAVVMGLATLGDPAQYGIPEWMVPYLRLGALVVGIVSGYLKASPLPKGNQ